MCECVCISVHLTQPDERKSFKDFILRMKNKHHRDTYICDDLLPAATPKHTNSDSIFETAAGQRAHNKRIWNAH